MFELLILPFFVCVLLAFVHVYFGAFVLRRGIIFIDLALAQWAAFGYLVAYLIGLHSPILLFLFGFLFTIIASLILTFLKPFYFKVNQQEAMIGVVYIVASVLSLGCISLRGLEGSHLQEMFVGQLLFVSNLEVLFSTLLYACIGFVLYYFHRYFLQNSSRLSDFLFYILFGLVVTSSVKLVGVLLVFSFLVLPVLTMVLFYDRLIHRVLWGWGLAIFASIFGLIGSAFIDLAPSYCVIFMLSIFWFFGIVIRLFKQR